ncbi:MAG TPA: transcriptional regulator [Clostridiales bacterium]|nr:transcriptional regulator [Clostridiales bacterium]
MRNISEAVTIRLKELLDERGLSVYKLERRSAVSHDTLKSIMKGKTKGVNLKTLIALSDGLGITVSEFLNSELFSYDNLNMD